MTAISVQHLTVTARASRCRRRWRWQTLIHIALTVIAIGCAVWIWPARFGGDTTVLAVEGSSMQPTFNSGDLVVARTLDHYNVGDIVIFRVPTTAGHSANVVHRIIALNADGTVTTQGDNRSTADGFHTTMRDIVGEAKFHIPRGVLALRVLGQWWLLALLTGALVTARLWPGNEDPTPTMATGSTARSLGSSHIRTQVRRFGCVRRLQHRLRRPWRRVPNDVRRGVRRAARRSQRGSAPPSTQR